MHKSLIAALILFSTPALAESRFFVAPHADVVMTEENGHFEGGYGLDGVICDIAGPGMLRCNAGEMIPYSMTDEELVFSGLEMERCIGEECD